MLHSSTRAIWVPRLLVSPLQVAASYVNLGGLLKALGRQREALPYFMKALDIRERAFGPEHPDVSGAQLCLAELLKDLGRWDAACLWMVACCILRGI